MEHPLVGDVEGVEDELPIVRRQRGAFEAAGDQQPGIVAEVVTGESFARTPWATSYSEANIPVRSSCRSRLAMSSSTAPAFAASIALCRSALVVSNAAISEGLAIPSAMRRRSSIMSMIEPTEMGSSGS